MFSHNKTKDARITELEQDVLKLRYELSDERLRRAEAEAHVAILKLEIERPRVYPYYDTAFGFLCTQCEMELTEDYRYCPGCGCPIAWNEAPPENEDVDAYDRRFDR